MEITVIEKNETRRQLLINTLHCFNAKYTRKNDNIIIKIRSGKRATRMIEKLKRISSNVHVETTCYYKREVDAGHGIQIMTIRDGRFSDIETFSKHASSYYTDNFAVPEAYTSGEPMPRGFLSDYGFTKITSKRYIENYYMSL